MKNNLTRAGNLLGKLQKLWNLYINGSVIFSPPQATENSSNFCFSEQIFYKKCQMSRVVYKASCWDCQDFYYTDKTKRRLHDRKTEHFKYETLACIAGGILLPGVLFWRRSSHTRRAVKLQGNTHLNTHSSHSPAAKTIQHPHANPTSYACRLLWVAITPLLLLTMSCHKWDHFEILAKRTVRLTAD